MEKPWLQHYPPGVPVQVNVDEFSSVIDMVDQSVKKYKDLEAFVSMGKSLTFGELDEKSRTFAAFLQSRGLSPGDRIALMMPNLLQYPIALLGALRAGLVVVNTNPLYTPREMRHQFIDSGAKAIVIAENFASNLQKVIADTGINTVITTTIGELLGFKGWIVNKVVRWRGMVPKFELSGAISFTEAMSKGRDLNLTPVTTGPDDTIILQYTGGTTGVSKGSMLTNRNLVANMLQIRAIMMPKLKEATETALCPLPLYHIFAFTVNCLAVMSIGGRNILIVNARDLKTLIKEWRTHNPTLVTGVNTLFNGLMNKSAFSTLDFSSLKICCAGGMALQRAVAERWQQTTGCQLTEGYGMTEASPVISCNPFDSTMRIGTIGLPVPSTDVRIVGENKEALPQGEVGEIQCKGPQVMKGYWNRPEATAEVLSHDGWLSTGDMGYMHPDGFFQIVDRKKDMILVSGFNVYPNEIEDVVVMHPKVLEVAAIGVPDEKSGEVVKVFIVKKDPSLTEDDIISHCREHLTGYKVPKKVEFRNELPKTNVGKILRRALRESVA